MRGLYTKANLVVIVIPMQDGCDVIVGLSTFCLPFLLAYLRFYLNACNAAVGLLVFYLKVVNPFFKV